MLTGDPRRQVVSQSVGISGTNGVSGTSSALAASLAPLVSGTSSVSGTGKRLWHQQCVGGVSGTNGVFGTGGVSDTTGGMSGKRVWHQQYVGGISATSGVSGTGKRLWHRRRCRWCLALAVSLAPAVPETQYSLTRQGEMG
ncbi:MAG: hypothetical protein LBC46_05245 [Treponema sp.]|nr:hypothetical protein [Treponema sp.]